MTLLSPIHSRMFVVAPVLTPLPAICTAAVPWFLRGGDRPQSARRACLGLVRRRRGTRHGAAGGHAGHGGSPGPSQPPSAAL
jgi:hypothetical protein